MTKTYPILSTEKQMSQTMKQRMNPRMMIQSMGIKTQGIRMTMRQPLVYVEALGYGEVLRNLDSILW
jgi:hypothetical protein